MKHFLYGLKAAVMQENKKLIFEFLDLMNRQKGKYDDLALFITLSKSFQTEKRFKEGLFWYDAAIEYSEREESESLGSKISSSSSCFNTSLNMAFDSGDRRHVKKILSDMSSRNLPKDEITYCTLIFGYAVSFNDLHKAEEVIKEVQESGMPMTAKLRKKISMAYHFNK